MNPDDFKPNLVEYLIKLYIGLYTITVPGFIVLLVVAPSSGAFPTSYVYLNDQINKMWYGLAALAEMIVLHFMLGRMCWILVYTKMYMTAATGWIRAIK